MSVQYFTLSDGSITINNDHVVIEDNARKRRINLITALAMLSLVPISNLVKGFRKGDDDDKLIGLLFAVPIFISLLFKYHDLYPVFNEFSLRDIQSVRCTYYSMRGDYEMVLRFKNGRIRRLMLLVDDSQTIALQRLLVEKGIMLTHA